MVAWDYESERRLKRISQSQPLTWDAVLDAAAWVSASLICLAWVRILWIAARQILESL